MSEAIQSEHTPMKEMTLEQAKARQDLRIRTQAANLPLRFRPVIVTGPNDGFLVVELGFAQANDFPIVA